MVFPWEEWSKRFEGRARALFLQRSHLLSQSQVFDNKVGSAPAHRPDRARAERDEEDENTEHGGGVCPFPLPDLKRELSL